MTRNFGVRNKDSVERELRRTEWKVLLGTVVALAAIVVFIYTV